MQKKVIVAGAGFSGMSLAANLVKKDFNVEVYEKNESPGGKIRQYVSDGFIFDMGASIYFFPEIFERYYNRFNHTSSDFYSLKRLDPAYRVFFNPEKYFDVAADEDKLMTLCDKFERNGAKSMVRYLQVAGNYYKQNLNELFNSKGLENKKHFHNSWVNSYISDRKHKAYVRKLFKSYQIISLLEFPLPYLRKGNLFAPNVDFITNYSILKQGVFYPTGGMHQVEESLSTILEELGVPVYLSSEIKNFDIIGNSIAGILTHQKNFHADIFASTLDYFHTEKLIGKEYRDSKNVTSSTNPNFPSAVIFCLGIKKKLPRLQHLNLLFNNCFEIPEGKIGKHKSDVNDCLIFIICSSKSDLEKAPEGMENMVARISIPPGIEDTGKMREHYFNVLLNRLEEITGQTLKDEIVLKKSFAVNDIENGYNNKGHLLRGLRKMGSSFIWSPKIKNKHLANLYYAGIPGALGSGMASALLTGEMIANYIAKDNSMKNK
jgi:phytoene desaturase